MPTSLVDRVCGRRLANSEEDSEKIGVLSGVPSLGLDGLSSAAYGPEAALSILIPLGILGLSYIGPITLVILVLLGILYLSYRQTITAYPSGGGSYTVARENLGIRFGLLAAAALMLDYILNVAVGISAGVGALISVMPALQPHTLVICLITLAALTLANLRGAREAGLIFIIPTYLFIGTLLCVVGFGIAHMISAHGHPHPIIPPPPVPPATATATVWLLMRAFASGCTAMTGVEAVSNGVTIFAKPTVVNAQRTLTAIVVSLGVLLAGIAYLSHAYHIGAMDETRSDYQSILSQLTFAVVGRGVFYYVTLWSVIIVLALSANTSYAGFPRLCRLVACDHYLPAAFRILGRRLVYTVGILFLTTIAGILLVIFGGITDRLIPLFAVGAFLAFTLSQAGMVVHWLRAISTSGATAGTGPMRASMAVNGIGAIATAAALAVILFAKFIEGAWITLVIIPALLATFYAIKRHYDHVKAAIAFDKPLDLSTFQKPYVVVPIEGWNMISQRAVRFGLRISDHVDVIHIDVTLDVPNDAESDQQPQSDRARHLREQWSDYVEKPTTEAGIPTPRLLIIPSPFRQTSAKIMEYVSALKAEDPARIVAVIIPELVETRWQYSILHNHRAAALKASLLFQGDHRIVVINVPWYLD